MDLSSSMRYGTLLGFDIQTSTRATNNPDTLVPTFGHYSSSSAGLTGPTTNRTSAYDNYTISPSNTTAGNSSYNLTYINGFYQNAAYASTLIRAFDSFTSTDGGNTWTAPTSGAIAAVASLLLRLRAGRRRASFQVGEHHDLRHDRQGRAGQQHHEHPLGAGRLLGLSAAAGHLGDRRHPQSLDQADYSATGTRFNGYTQGPGYYGKTFFIWPPDPRTGAIPDTTTLSYLDSLGITNTTDQNTIAASGTDLTNLTIWLKKRRRTAAQTAAPRHLLPVLRPGQHSKAPIYYAVCRLFNRAYPAGAAMALLRDWRLRFFGTDDNTKLFDSSGSLNPPGSSGMYTALQTYNAILQLDHPVAEPLPDAVAGRPHQVLRIDPDLDHRDLAQLRQHGPALLGRVHRPRARLQTNLGGRLPGHQRRWPATAAISPGEPWAISAPPLRDAIHELHGQPGRAPSCATGSAPSSWSITCITTTCTRTRISTTIMSCSPGIATRRRSTPAGKPSRPPSTRCRTTTPTIGSLSSFTASRASPASSTDSLQ